uniref:Uncharacterized protein n=1 Tax=Aegilops tauschii subsp. strangulata TaxID=200361 RepID=A0A452YZF8_AEGTS
PPSRRAPRLAKRRHAATTSRSRAQPSTSTSASAPWNPFLGGGTDAAGQDGTGGPGSVAGGGGYEFGKGQKVGNVFGPAPAARRPPPAASNEAPFVFGSVRDSLPRFDVGSSAASKLDHKMGKLNLQSPGTEVPLQNEGAKVGPKAFVFGSNGAGSFADSRSTASSCADSYASSSAQVTKANGTPESGHAESTNDAAADYRAHDASVLQEKITQLNIGSGTFQYMKDGGSGSRQTEVLGSGDGRTAGTIFGNASSNTSDKGSIFFSFGNSSASISANGAANVPPERASNLNVGGGVKQSMKSDDTNCSPETFVFGRNGTTYSASEQSARVVMDDGDNSGSGASTSTCTSAHGTMGSTLPEKMTKLNIEQVIPSQSVKDEAATRQPEPFVFGSNATSSFSSLKTTSFTSFQTNVSSESKGSRRSLANDGSGSSVTILSEGATEHALQDEIKKLNINKEGPSAGNVNASDACTPKFSFQSKVEAVPRYCTFPQPKVQESCPFTPSNHSSTYSTSANVMPSFSSNPPNGGSESAPGESCAVKQDPTSCSRESLFGIDYIKSAYRDKKEAHRSTRKKKRPTRLKQHGQLHQVSQETCANGLASDLTGDYSPMDCSPYQAAVEQVPREAFVSCDQSTDICDGSVPNQNTSCAEDDLVSATEHLVIDADLPTCQDEGRDPIADASESNFGSNFSSFDGEINFYDAPQPIFTNMNVDANGEPKVYTTEAWVDGSGCNVSGPTCEENTSRTPHESGEPVNIQSSSANLSGLNFTFGASLYPESSLPTQRHTTKRKLRTKVGQAPKPSATQASVQPKGSQDTKSMQFSPETSTTENSVKEQLRRDASVSADLETCETWRTSGNQAYANGHFATAEGCYTRGINSISQYATSGRCSHALMLCYSNRAATRMSLGRMREALQDCSIATSIDPTFLKAKVRAAKQLPTCAWGS